MGAYRPGRGNMTMEGGGFQTPQQGGNPFSPQQQHMISRGWDPMTGPSTPHMEGGGGFQTPQQYMPFPGGGGFTPPPQQQQYAPSGGLGSQAAQLMQLLQHPLIQHLASGKGGPGQPAGKGPMTMEGGGGFQTPQAPFAGPQGSGVLQQLLQMFGGGGQGGEGRNVL